MLYEVITRSPETVARLRRSMRRIWLVILPLIIIATLGELDPARLANDVLGQCLSIVSLLALSPLIFINARSHHDPGQPRTFSASIGILLSLVPLVLVGLVVMGYYYTALKLTSRFIDSFYLVVAWVLVYASAVRGLAVAARP